MSNVEFNATTISFYHFQCRVKLDNNSIVSGTMSVKFDNNSIVSGTMSVKLDNNSIVSGTMSVKLDDNSVLRGPMSSSKRHDILQCFVLGFSKTPPSNG